MPSNKKPRKPHTKKNVNWFVAENLKKKLHEESKTDLEIFCRLSMEMLTKGESDEQHWANVACALDITLILCEMGFCKESSDVVLDALDGAFKAKVRGQQTGAWRFDGDSLKAIRAALDVHSRQIGMVTLGQFKQARNTVEQRVRKGNIYRAVYESK